MYCKNVSIEADILYMSPEFYILEKGTSMFRVIMKGGGGFKGTDVKKILFPLICICILRLFHEKDSQSSITNHRRALNHTLVCDWLSVKDE